MSKPEDIIEPDGSHWNPADDDQLGDDDPEPISGNVTVDARYRELDTAKATIIAAIIEAPTIATYGLRTWLAAQAAEVAQLSQLLADTLTLMPLPGTDDEETSHD